MVGRTLSTWCPFDFTNADICQSSVLWQRGRMKLRADDMSALMSCDKELLCHTLTCVSLCKTSCHTLTKPRAIITTYSSCLPIVSLSVLPILRTDDPTRGGGERERERERV